jgi:hypothetical protein
MTAAHDLDGAIATLRGAPRLDRATVEGAFGARLNTGDGNDAFAFYAAEAVPLGAVTVSLDLRVPVPGGGATAGPLLNVRVVNGCPPRAGVEARYGPLTPTGMPRGHSRDELFSFSREEPWGRLSFGFAERAPDCLASVTLAHVR